MPRSAKPRKAHRPRGIARPVMEKMRRDLILPAYAALTMLQTSADHDALSDAMSSIVVLCNFMSRAADVRGFDVATVEAAKVSLLSIIERHDRRGVYRATGEELQRLRAAVVWADDTLPRLDTLRLTDALLYVDRKMVEMGVTE